MRAGKVLCDAAAMQNQQVNGTQKTSSNALGGCPRHDRLRYRWAVQRSGQAVAVAAAVANGRGRRPPRDGCGCGCRALRCRAGTPSASPDVPGERPYGAGASGCRALPTAVGRCRRRRPDIAVRRRPVPAAFADAVKGAERVPFSRSNEVGRMSAVGDGDDKRGRGDPLASGWHRARSESTGARGRVVGPLGSGERRHPPVPPARVFPETGFGVDGSTVPHEFDAERQLWQF